MLSFRRTSNDDDYSDKEPPSTAYQPHALGTRDPTLPAGGHSLSSSCSLRSMVDLPAAREEVVSAQSSSSNDRIGRAACDARLEASDGAARLREPKDDNHINAPHDAVVFHSTRSRAAGQETMSGSMQSFHSLQSASLECAPSPRAAHSTSGSRVRATDRGANTATAHSTTTVAATAATAAAIAVDSGSPPKASPTDRREHVRPGTALSDEEHSSKNGDGSAHTASTHSGPSDDNLTAFSVSFHDVKTSRSSSRGLHGDSPGSLDGGCRQRCGQRWVPQYELPYFAIQSSLPTTPVSCSSRGRRHRHRERSPRATECSEAFTEERNVRKPLHLRLAQRNARVGFNVYGDPIGEEPSQEEVHSSVMWENGWVSNGLTRRIRWIFTDPPVSTDPANGTSQGSACEPPLASSAFWPRLRVCVAWLFVFGLLLPVIVVQVFVVLVHYAPLRLCGDMCKCDALESFLYVVAYGWFYYVPVAGFTPILYVLLLNVIAEHQSSAEASKSAVRAFGGGPTAAIACEPNGPRPGTAAGSTEATDAVQMNDGGSAADESTEGYSAGTESLSLQEPRRRRHSRLTPNARLSYTPGGSATSPRTPASVFSAASLHTATRSSHTTVTAARAAPQWSMVLPQDLHRVSVFVPTPRHGAKDSAADSSSARVSSPVKPGVEPAASSSDAVTTTVVTESGVSELDSYARLLSSATTYIRAQAWLLPPPVIATDCSSEEVLHCRSLPTAASSLQYSSTFWVCVLLRYLFLVFLDTQLPTSGKVPFLLYGLLRACAVTLPLFVHAVWRRVPLCCLPCFLLDFFEWLVLILFNSTDAPSTADFALISVWPLMVLVVTRIVEFVALWAAAFSVSRSLISLPHTAHSTVIKVMIATSFAGLYYASVFAAALHICAQVDEGALSLIPFTFSLLVAEVVSHTVVLERLRSRIWTAAFSQMFPAHPAANGLSCPWRLSHTSYSSLGTQVRGPAALITAAVMSPIFEFSQWPRDPTGNSAQARRMIAAITPGGDRGCHGYVGPAGVPGTASAAAAAACSLEIHWHGFLTALVVIVLVDALFVALRFQRDTWWCRRLREADDEGGPPPPSSNDVQQPAEKDRRAGAGPRPEKGKYLFVFSSARPLVLQDAILLVGTGWFIAAAGVTTGLMAAPLWLRS